MASTLEGSLGKTTREIPLKESLDTASAMGFSTKVMPKTKGGRIKGAPMRLSLIG
jgi:hypothetical protein